MDNVTFPDFVRGVLIAAALLTAVGFAVRIFWGRLWESPENKFLHWGALLGVLALASRSLVAIQDRDPLKWPLILFFASLIMFAAYLTSPRGRSK